MKTNLVWNTHSSKWGKRTEDYEKEWKIQLTAQKEKQLKEALMCVHGADGRTALRSRESYIY